MKKKDPLNNSALEQVSKVEDYVRDSWISSVQEFEKLIKSKVDLQTLWLSDKESHFELLKAAGLAKVSIATIQLEKFRADAMLAVISACIIDNREVLIPVDGPIVFTRDDVESVTAKISETVPVIFLGDFNRIKKMKKPVITLLIDKSFRL